MSDDLLDLFGNIESSGGLTSSNEYQTGPGFSSQFGYGAPGVTNFADQAVTANPNISVGDLYAEYNQGTGTPGSGETYAQLASDNPAAYANLNNNLSIEGLTSSTPAASLISTTPGISVTEDEPTDSFGSDIAGSVAMGDNPLGYDTSTGINTVPTGSEAGAPGAFSSLTNAGAALGSAPTFWQQLIGDVENLAARGGLILIGIVLIAAAAYALSQKDVQNAGARVVRVATKPLMG